MSTKFYSSYKKPIKVKKAKSSIIKSLPPFNYNPQFSFSHMNDIVTLHIRLLTWNYLDFDMKVSSDTQFSFIRHSIAERNQIPIKDIRIYVNQVQPTNLIVNDNQSLNQLGIIGGSDELNIEYNVYYDTNAFPSDCHLLMIDRYVSTNCYPNNTRVDKFNHQSSYTSYTNNI